MRAGLAAAVLVGLVAMVLGCARASGGGQDAGVDAGTDAEACADPCELVSQCGCGADQACDLDSALYATGGTACRAVTAPGIESSTCGGTTACAAGYTCVGPVGARSCRRFCAVHADCVTPGGKCVSQLEYGSPPMDIPGARICSPNCDPVTSAGCPPTWGCHVLHDSPANVDFTTCNTAGSGDHHTACAEDTDCLADYSCIELGSGFECLRNCDASTGVGCEDLPGTGCVGYSVPSVVGGTEYGSCVEP